MSEESCVIIRKAKSALLPEDIFNFLPPRICCFCPEHNTFHDLFSMGASNTQFKCPKNWRYPSFFIVDGCYVGPYGVCDDGACVCREYASLSSETCENCGKYAESIHKDYLTQVLQAQMRKEAKEGGFTPELLNTFPEYGAALMRAREEECRPTR